MRKCIVFLFLLCFGSGLSLYAQSWDYIRSSGEYYYGSGTGKTELEADKAALSDLVQMISVQVSSDFQMQTDDQNMNGTVDHKSYVRNCVNTYASSALTNVEKRVEGEEPNITVRRYMLRSELSKIYEKRIEKAQDMVVIAENALAKLKVDMALQYYYWAYSLIRSLQYPTSVKNAEGHSLVSWIPVKIRSILEGIEIRFERSEENYVDMFFNYNGQPVSGLDFVYSDGRENCNGSAKDGRGTLEMAPGYETDFYHLELEYEYKNLARGDGELQAVLDVVNKTVFPEAAVKVKAGKQEHKALTSTSTTARQAQMVALEHNGTTNNIQSVPMESQVIEHVLPYRQKMEQVIDAIKKRRYTNAGECFTIEGLDIYNRLISYGAGRVLGEPALTYYRGLNNTVIVRGLQMSFSFKSGPRKKTFVEDVVFTFNGDKQICNVTFGLGKVAEADILKRYAPGWKNETRELIMEFLENYKTAYCLKRLQYIRDIFADDAVIIVGNIVKRNLASIPENRTMSLEGQDIIKYNRYDKETYLQNLARTFRLNEFINLRFSNIDVQWLEKYEDEEIYGIQIGQEYSSSRYADKGFLFLLVDMTDHNSPQIKVRTWQPNEVSMSKIFSAGDFYNE